MDLDLTAPRYEAATAYHAPAPAPFDFGIDMLTLEELLQSPKTRAILQKHAPWALAMADIELFRPYISLFTVRDVAKALPMDFSKGVAAVDAALRAMPASERPIDVR